MPDNNRAARLNAFTRWVHEHLSGDEKGEAQLFLDRLFQAFGWEGLREAGAILELRVSKDSGGTSFADLVWKPIVLIEMKKRGADLSRHYRQAFDYWTRLVPNRPRYTILCNFDEFWIYDFETQMDTPVDTVRLLDLSTCFGPLAFLFPDGERPIFGNHQETVTRQAADKLANCFNSLKSRGIERAVAQRFILQFLMALFAEDIGLLEKYFVTRLLDDSKTPADAYDMIGGLFDAMNTIGGVQGGRYKGVPYFNGGLFTEPSWVELQPLELDLLREAAKFDWSKVRPEIFGTLFEHSLGKEDRHAYGAHFTSPVDIMKIVGPTIVDPWRSEIEKVDTLRGLRTLLERIEKFTVLDPACGSGNFLYIAYRELKRLEARIYERIATEYKSVDPAQRTFGFVTTRNFFGIDINPFAVEIAKVTMMLAHKLVIDELHITETALPLDNLDRNFAAGDALIGSDRSRAAWPKVDVIIGNPPFMGAKRLKPERGVEYVNAIRKAYPKIPGMADYCVYWFRRTQDELKPCTQKDPFAGRAGLVGTQNIRNNASRRGGLDYISAGGTIVEAVDNQPWSGEANVHVSIVNWTKTRNPKLTPAKRRLWSRAEIEADSTLSRRPEAALPLKTYELTFRDVPMISSTLSDKTDVSSARTLKCNVIPQRVFQGVTPGHDGFVLSPTEMRDLVSRDSVSQAVIFPYLIGREITSGDGSPRRYLIDFDDRSMIEAMRYPSAFQRIHDAVLPELQRRAEEEHASENARKQHLERWWMHWRHRGEMKAAIAKLQGRYLTASRTQHWPFIFSFMAKSVLPGDKMQVFAFDDDYSFGVIQSVPHTTWYVAKAARLKNELDYNYSVESVFDTFPWPQTASVKQIDAIAEAGREIRRVRASAKVTKGLRTLYHSLELPGKNPLKDAHVTLNDAVLSAYGFSGKRDLLGQILELNQSVAAPLAAGGRTPISPGIPPTYPDPTALISEDSLGRP